MRRRAVAVVGMAICVGLSAAGIAVAVVTHLPISLPIAHGAIRPAKLPRDHFAAAELSLNASWAREAGASPPPRLASIELELGRRLSINPNAVPVCGRSDLEGASMDRAGRLCGGAEVGRGSVELWLDDPDCPECATTMPTMAFNGRVGGRPAILVHGAVAPPFAGGGLFTLVFKLSKGHGPFSLGLSARVPMALRRFSSMTSFRLNLLDGPGRGGRSGYLTASCPAPRSFPVATLPLLRLELGFEEGLNLSETLEQSCRVR